MPTLGAPLAKGVNTYITVAEAQTYATNNGSGATVSEGNVRRAFAYVESYRDRFVGTKVGTGVDDPQRPRRDACIDDIYVPVDAIPFLICEAQAEASLQFAEGNDPLQTATTQHLIRERFGDVEFQYSDHYGPPPNQQVILRRVDELLAPALEYGGNNQPILRR